MIAAVYARKSTDQNLPDAEKSVTRQIAIATTYATRSRSDSNQASRRDQDIATQRRDTGAGR